MRKTRDRHISIEKVQNPITDTCECLREKCVIRQKYFLIACHLAVFKSFLFMQGVEMSLEFKKSYFLIHKVSLEKILEKYQHRHQKETYTLIEPVLCLLYIIVTIVSHTVYLCLSITSSCLRTSLEAFSLHTLPKNLRTMKT